MPSWLLDMHTRPLSMLSWPSEAHRLLLKISSLLEMFSWLLSTQGLLLETPIMLSAQTSPWSNQAKTVESLLELSLMVPECYFSSGFGSSQGFFASDSLAQRPSLRPLLQKVGMHGAFVRLR